MTQQEKQWLFLDWQDGRDISELCDEYGIDETQVYAVIREQLGIKERDV